MKTKEPALSWYEIPAEVKRLLLAAVDHWEDTQRSQAYVEQAIADPNVSLDVLVAAYRYFFYKHNDPLALQIATRVMEQIRNTESLPETWAEVKPILVNRREDSKMRLYLNAYAASGLVLARLGELEKAKEITSQIQEIDEKRESCAATVFGILTQPEDEDE